MKYLTPIYKALLDSDQKDIAVQWFKENEDFYHPYAVDQLKQLLGLNEVQKKPVSLTEALYKSTQMIGQYVFDINLW